MTPGALLSRPGGVFHYLPWSTGGKSTYFVKNSPNSNPSPWTNFSIFPSFGSRSQRSINDIYVLSTLAASASSSWLNCSSRRRFLIASANLCWMVSESRFDLFFTLNIFDQWYQNVHGQNVYWQNVTFCRQNVELLLSW